MSYVLVFLAMTGLDFAYGEYTKAAADRRIYPASTWAVILYVLGAFVMLNVVGNAWCIAAAAAGAFAGTWLSIRFGK